LGISRASPSTYQSVPLSAIVIPQCVSSSDNVFVQVAVAVQYRVVAEGAYEAFYRLTDPKSQIQAYVFDVVRSTVPKMELDEAFASKDEIATAVLAQLQTVMRE
jgi:regulator of protease activity HflC (stomatin/prohibitin superfamily)